MQCFQDCCLFCDRDSPDGPYCSQRCKLADHERSTSPTSQQVSLSSPTNWYTQTSAARRQSTYFGVDASSSSSQYYNNTTTYQPSRLSPSSSRSSLSSTSSSSAGSIQGISAQARQDLQGFFSSFDQAKASKRRSSTR